ncbi:cache domain-containing protein [Deferrisoma sp.]
MIPRRGFHRRVVLAFGALGLLSLVISAGVAAWVVRGVLVSQVQAQMAGHLRAAREIYDARLERLLDGVRFAAGLPGVRRALVAGDAPNLTAELQAARVRLGEDVLSAAGPGGLALARARNPSRTGDPVTALPSVRRALLGEATVSTEAVPLSLLEREAPDLARAARLEVVSTPRAAPGGPSSLDEALVAVAAAPVSDERGRIRGCVYALDVLSADPGLVDRIRRVVFGEASPGTATLFLRDVRVATNVPAPGGGRAVGTRASAEVARQVLGRGEPWIDRAFVVDRWYLSAYAPLRSAAGEPVGILYVGLPEGPYRTLLWKTLAGVAALHGVGLVPVLLVAAALAGSVVKPVRLLARAARDVAGGRLEAEIPVRGDDELAELAREFRAMIQALRERDREIETLNRDLERKVRERSAELERRNEDLLRARAELLALMERQRETNEELEASLRRLRDTQDELVRSGKLAALGALAAGVAHEINNPLAAIQANTELLLLRAEADPEIAEEAQAIAEQVERIQKIVASLLTFARPRAEAGREAVDLHRLVVETLELAAPQARKNRVAVETRADPDLPAAWGDPDKLRQVLTNLVVNALEHSPRGGTVRIATGRGDDGATVWVRVEDEGPGVPAAERDRIWNPFYTTRSEGTGLGLSIAHAIVEDHGGRIVLDSAPGRGAAFTVILPRAA